MFRNNVPSILLFALLLTGCGGQYVLQLPDSRPAVQESFSFIDARSGEEIRWRVVANSPGNPFSQVNHIVLGDENFNPSRIDYLRKQLQMRVGANLAGKKLMLKTFMVKEYPIETNAIGRAAAMSAVSYPVGIMIEPGGVVGDVITVDIEIGIDDHIVSATAMRKYKSGKLEQAARSTIADAVDDLVGKLTPSSDNSPKAKRQ